MYIYIYPVRPRPNWTGLETNDLLRFWTTYPGNAAKVLAQSTARCPNVWNQSEYKSFRGCNGWYLSHNLDGLCSSDILGFSLNAQFILVNFHPFLSQCSWTLMLAAALAEHFADREELAEHAGPRATGANPPRPMSWIFPPFDGQSCQLCHEMLIFFGDFFNGCPVPNPGGFMAQIRFLTFSLEGWYLFRLNRLTYQHSTYADAPINCILNCQSIDRSLL